MFGFSRRGNGFDGRNSRSGKSRRCEQPKANRPVGSFALRLESLEDRQTPAISALFNGGISLVSGSTVNISKLTNDQTQPNIAVDPTNPSRMFAISNKFAGPLFGAYSTDAGQSWTKRDVATGADGLPQAFGDGQLAWDNFGNLFLTYIKSGVKSTVVAVSTDGGQSFATVLNNGSDFNNQPSLAVGNGQVWVSYQRGGVMRANGASVSGLGSIGSFGLERSMPVSGGFGGIAVGPIGQVMMTWSGISDTEGPEVIYCATDADGLGIGNFGSPVTVTSTNVGWYDDIPSLSTSNINPAPNVVFDSLGRAYLAYTDEVTNESNDTNIFLRTSDDNGATWSARRKVNDDATTRSQFFPSLAIDQDTGYVALSWYDCRGDAANIQAKIYATASTDRGLSFLPNVVVAPGPIHGGAASSSTELGQYSDVAFVGGSFFPVWADNSNSTGDNADGPSGTLEVVTARTRIQAIGGQTVAIIGSGADDTLNIKLDPSGTYVMFYENNPSLLGKPTLIVTKASLDSIIYNSAGGADQLTFDFFNGNPIPNGGIQFNGGTGADSIFVTSNLGYVLTDVSLSVTGSVGGVTLSSVETATLAGGSAANNFLVGSWTGTVNMYGGPSSDTYQVAMNNSLATYNITDNGIAGTDFATVTNAPGGAMNVTNSALTVVSESVNYSGLETLRLNASGGNNVFNVKTTSAKTNIVGAGGTVINVGNAGSLQGIQGVLNLENPSAYNAITLDDSTNFLSKTVTMSSFQPNPDDSQGSSLAWSKTAGLSPYDINVKYNDTQALTIKGGIGGNTFNINSHAQVGGCVTTIESGSGFDTFNLSAANLGTAGTINLKGQAGKDSFNLLSMPASTAIVNFDGGANVDSFHTNGGYADWNINAVNSTYVESISNGHVVFNNIENLYSSILNDTFNVNSTAASSTTNIVANNFTGNSFVYVGNGSTQGILGTVNVENYFGYNVVVINDSLDAIGRTVAIDSFANNPDTPNPDGLTWLKFNGLAPAIINVKMDFNGLDVYAGTGADTFNMSGNYASLMSIDGGGPAAPNLAVADRLNMDMSNAIGALMSPTANGSGEWAFLNQQGVWFSRFERMNPGVTISGRVFKDLDNNGNDNGGTEPGMAGVTVTLDSLADGVADLTTTTSADGSYSFVDLAPCTYRVRQAVPSGYTQSTVNPTDLTFNAPMSNTGRNFGNVEFVAPTITGVFFDSTAWAGSFRTAAGNANYGYRAQVGANQMTTMPWSNINTVYVAFSENVNLDVNDLALRGLNVANYTVSNMTYDSVNFVAKFTLAGNLDTDRMVLDLDGDSASAVTDTFGNKLAGGWTDSVSSFPTTGSAGNDFKFHFVVGVGDADRNGQVRNADTNVVRGNLFIDAGQSGYNLFADIDGNGQLRNADLNAVRSHLFIDPPTGPGPSRPVRSGNIIDRRTYESTKTSNDGANSKSSVLGNSSRVGSAQSARRLGTPPIVNVLDALFSDF